MTREVTKGSQVSTNGLERREASLIALNRHTDVACAECERWSSVYHESNDEEGQKPGHPH